MAALPMRLAIPQKKLLMLIAGAFLLAATTANWSASAQDDGQNGGPARTPQSELVSPDSPTEASRSKNAGTDDNIISAKPNDGQKANTKSQSSDRAESFCVELGWAAVRNDLPADFFLRLIWQESRFDDRAVSPAGALGIAQFMPATARWRGLADPFVVREALRESARWLAELRDQFGNLGLAAAAYNAGPKRIENWLAGKGGLPNETRRYVQAITGHSAEEWARTKVGDQAAFQAKKAIPCDQVAAVLVKNASRQPVPTPSQQFEPWGLQLTGNWSQAKALADYAELQRKFPAVLGGRPPVVLTNRIAGRGSALWYRVRVAEATREKADELCHRLERAGGQCLVFRN
jgi:Transglycosylase SLT domain/SPOR domain